MRETLRDRRTIGTLILMPLLVYPTLSFFFQGYLASSFRAPAAASFVFGVDSEQELEAIVGVLEQGRFLVESRAETERLRREHAAEPERDEPKQPATGSPGLETRWLVRDPVADESLEALVADGRADVGIRIEREPGEPAEVGEGPIALQLLYRSDSLRSQQARALADEYIDAVSVALAQERILNAGQDPRLPLVATAQAVVPRPGRAVSLAALVPLILILMTITGAVYPAIDLTAGERERGTLESLIAAPVHRVQILLAKLVAVVTVAVLTALVNLVGMAITLWVFDLGTTLFGERGLTAGVVLGIFGLLMLMACFFGSVLLVVTSFARSFKEAQAYLIPIVLLALVPGMLSMQPGVELRGGLAVAPLVNIVLLARDVIEGDAVGGVAVVVVAATIVYVLVAIAVAAQFFGTDAVLYGSSEGWREAMRRRSVVTGAEARETTRGYVPSAAASLLALAMMLPAALMWQGVSLRLTFLPYWIVTTSMMGVALIYWAWPSLVAWHRRADFRTTFALRRLSVPVAIGAVAIGLGAAPLLAQTIEWTSGSQAAPQVTESTADTAAEEASPIVSRTEALVESLRAAPAWLVLIGLSLVPAVCEEWFFRGMLFSSLLRSGFSPRRTIFVTALAFAVMHLITSPVLGLVRFLTTLVLGLVLGTVRYRGSSLLGPILLHAANNLLVTSLGYYAEGITARLIEWRWIESAEQGLPGWWLALSVALVASGGALIWAFGRPHTDAIAPSARA
jgi:ABC-type Na+ efflux pump permease subunit/membrane protease YdiL (CAAX protease family)